MSAILVPPPQDSSDWPDAPIQCASMDLLSRAPFANMLARLLLEDNPVGSTVIGLTGGWGSGKTSVANLVTERIKDEVDVVTFEPWMVMSPQALVAEFFHVLGKALLPASKSPQAKVQRAAFYRYAVRIMAVIQPAVESAALVGVPGASVAAMGIKQSGRVLDAAASSLETDAARPTLSEARASIKEFLQRSTRPLVVVIDDIDRLSRKEVRTVFQLMKACTDFPNVRFLVLFDFDQVVHALKEFVNSPELFLDKVITHRFDLPEATRGQAESVLEASLDRFGLDKYALDDEARSRLMQCVTGVLLPGLPTVRDVKRFCSTVSALLPEVIADGHASIDPGDFLALEFIRQRVPTLYRMLRDGEAHRPGGPVAEFVQSEKERQEEFDKKKERVLGDVGEPMDALAREALGVLEEDIDTHRGLHGRHGLRQHRNRRFASEHWKPVYFGFSAKRAPLPEDKWQGIRSSLAQPQPRNWVELLNDPETGQGVATAIADRASELSADDLRACFGDVLAWAEDLVVNSPGGHGSPFLALYLIGAACLVELRRKGGDPVSTLRGVAQKAIFAASYLLGIEKDLATRSMARDNWASPEELQDLAEALKGPLKDRVFGTEFWDQPLVAECLRAWMWVDPAAYEEWFQNLPDSSQLAQYVNKVLGAHRNASGFRFNGDTTASRFFQAVERLEDGLLDENGRWAKRKYISDIRAASHRDSHEAE